MVHQPEAGTVIAVGRGEGMFSPFLIRVGPGVNGGAAFVTGDCQTVNCSCISHPHSNESKCSHDPRLSTVGQKQLTVSPAGISFILTWNYRMISASALAFEVDHVVLYAWSF
jgi:hypothetical protein